jgi:hypothetical protein
VSKRGRPSGFPDANHIAVGMVHYLYNVFFISNSYNVDELGMIRSSNAG